MEEKEGREEKGLQSPGERKKRCSRSAVRSRLVLPKLLLPPSAPNISKDWRGERRKRRRRRRRRRQGRKETTSRKFAA